MEIKINKEIRAYQESIFFGLSMRQLFCSACAVGTAVVIYFLLEKPLGKEMVSWICIVGAAPIGAAGFFKYNGLTIEKFALAFLKSKFICARRRVFKAENYYQMALNNKNRSVKVNDKNPKK